MASVEPHNDLSRCNSFVSSPSVLSDAEIESCCHLYATQTNSRLLHVLSDLVKAFLDTENDIQKALEKLGFSYDERSSSGREEILPSIEDAIERLSYNETGNDLCEDGPELITTPSSTFYSSLTLTPGVVNIAAGNAEDDILLGASRRLRSAVERILHLLQEIVSSHHLQEKFFSKSGSDEIVCLKDPETEDLKAQLESSSKQISSFQKFIEQQAKEREYERDEFNLALQKLEEKLKEKERREAKMKDELEAYEVQLMTLADEKKELEKKLAETNANLKKVTDTAEEYRQIIQQIEKENEDYTKVEKQLKKKVNELEEAIHFQAHLNEEIQREHLSNSNSWASAVMESINLRTSQLQRTLNMGEAIDLSDYSLSLSASKPDLNYNCQSSAGDDSSIECSYADLNILDEKMKMLNSYIDKLVAQNVKLKSDLEYITSNNKTFDDKCNQLLQEKSRLENELREVKREEEIIREELNNKRLQLSALKSRFEGNVGLDIVQLKQANEELKRNLAKEENKCENLKQQIAQLTLINEERNMEIEQLTREIKSVSTAVASVKNKIKKVETEKARLSKVESDLLLEKEMLLKQETQFRNEIETLCKEKEELTTRLMNSTAKSESEDVLSQLLQKVIKDKNEEIKCLSRQLENVQNKILTVLPDSCARDVVYLIDDLIDNFVDLKTQLSKKAQAQSASTSPFKHPESRNEKAVNTENSAAFNGAETYTDLEVEKSEHFMDLQSEKTRIEEELHLCKQHLNEVYLRLSTVEEENSVLNEALHAFRQQQKDLNDYRLEVNKDESDNETDAEMMSQNNLHEALEKLHNNSRELLILSEAHKCQKEAILRQLIETLPFAVSEDSNSVECIASEEWKQQFLDSFPQKEIGQLLYEKLSQINRVYVECNAKAKFYSHQYENVVKKLTEVERELAELQEKAARCQQNFDKMKEKSKNLEQKLKESEELKVDLEERMQMYRLNYKLAKEDYIKCEQQLKELGRKYSSGKLNMDQNELYFKLKRCLSHKNALVYQKKYLLKVLGGFQLTEKATLALLANMNVTMEESSISSKSGISRFRVAVLTLISISRMKFLVRKNCIKNLFNGHNHLTRSNVSLSKYKYKKSALGSSVNSLSSSRSETNATLEEFVTRLKNLHQTLGLRAERNLSDFSSDEDFSSSINRSLLKSRSKSITSEI